MVIDDDKKKTIIQWEIFQVHVNNNNHAYSMIGHFKEGRRENPKL